jgi:hypothetical protein
MPHQTVEERWKEGFPYRKNDPDLPILWRHPLRMDFFSGPQGCPQPGKAWSPLIEIIDDILRGLRRSLSLHYGLVIGHGRDFHEATIYELLRNDCYG